MRKLVYVIGMGPGNFEQMTFEARRALEQSDVIVGYTVYVDLLREHFPDKQFLTTPMRQEVERCRMAFEKAGQVKRRRRVRPWPWSAAAMPVCMVCPD